MPKESKRQVLRRNRVGQFFLKFKPLRWRQDVMAMQKVNVSKRKHEQTIKGPALHNIKKPTHVNDINRECLGHIFSFLTIKDKLNFGKVCSAWKAMFKRFWKMIDLRVNVFRYEPSFKVTKIDIKVFYALLKIGGYHLKSITITADQKTTNWLRASINSELCVVIGLFNLCDFFKAVAKFSGNIRLFDCFVSASTRLYPKDIRSLAAAMRKLIVKNRKIKCYKMCIFQPHFELFALEDLPETVEDVQIQFYIEDSPNIRDWLLVAKNLRTLSFYRNPNHDETHLAYENDVVGTIYLHARNIKVLQITLPSMYTVMSSLERISTMKNLEEMYITFPVTDLLIDDFLIAISFGCKNLRKLLLQSCNFSYEGMNFILKKLELTHLYIHYSYPKFNANLIRQKTLRTLKLNNCDIKQSCLKKIVRNFINLRSIVITGVKMIEAHVNELCTACPKLEEVELAQNGTVVFDRTVHHLLMTLSNLKTVKLPIEDVENIVPLDVNFVHKNLQDVTLLGLNQSHNLAQLTKLSNLRRLTIVQTERHLTQPEMEAISVGCEKLEEIHFEEFPECLDVNVAKKMLESLMRAKSSLRLVTINAMPCYIEGIVEKTILRKQGEMILETTKIDDVDTFPIIPK